MGSSERLCKHEVPACCFEHCRHDLTFVSVTTVCFPGVFSRPALRALPSFSKPSPARQRQLRGPGLLREPGSPRRASPTGWPQHALAGSKVHRQLCWLLLSLAALQRAQLWDQPLSSLTRLLGLRGDEGGGFGGGGGEDGWWTVKGVV